jgi:hypothetical protein
LSASAAATCVVSATKAGDNTFNESNSPTQSFIFLGAQATLTISNTTLTNAVGTAVSLTTAGGSGSGATTYALSTANALCSLTGSTLSATSGTTCSVTATKAASGIYAPTTSAPVSFIFKGAQATLSISNTTLTNAVGTTVVITTAGGSGSGALSYTVSGTNCALSGASLSASAAATCVVSATKAGDGTYAESNSATKSFIFLGAQAPLTISNTVLINSVRTSVALTTTGGSGTGEISYALATPNSSCSISRRGVLTAKAGTTCSVIATKAASGLFASIISEVKNFIFN